MLRFGLVLLLPGAGSVCGVTVYLRCSGTSVSLTCFPEFLRAVMTLGIFSGTCRSSCASIAGHVSQQGWTCGQAPADFFDISHSSLWWECPWDLLSLPCCLCLWLLQKHETEFSLSDMMRICTKPKIVGGRDRWTYTSTSPNSVTVKGTLL